jgi:23S rRNA pseudouridine2457 synthase
LEPGQWRAVTPEEDNRLQALLRQPRGGRHSPGRGGRAGGGKSGQGGGGG